MKICVLDTLHGTVESVNFGIFLIGKSGDRHRPESRSHVQHDPAAIAGEHIHIAQISVIALYRQPLLFIAVIDVVRRTPSHFPGKDHLLRLGHQPLVYQLFIIFTDQIRIYLLKSLAVFDARYVFGKIVGYRAVDKHGHYVFIEPQGERQFPMHPVVGLKNSLRKS